MGTIELTLTQIKKFWFLAFRKKVKVGFSFTNIAMLICARNLKIDLDDFFDWAEKNQTLYFSEMLYAAYLAFCQSRYIKPQLTKKELLSGFSELDEDKQKEVLTVWRDSESFGVKKDKKKVKKK